MALSPAEKQKRYRERRKARQEAQPEATGSFLRRPFNEYLADEENWFDLMTTLEWAGISLDGMPTFDADEDPEWNEETDGPYSGSIGRAERMVGVFLDVASDLAEMINRYKRQELDRAIEKIKQADMSDPTAREAALADMVRLSKIRERLEKQVRWTIPQWKVKGE